MFGLNVNFAKCRGSNEDYELQSENFFVYLSWPSGGANSRRASTWNPMVEAINKGYILRGVDMLILEEVWFLLI